MNEITAYCMFGSTYFFLESIVTHKLLPKIDSSFRKSRISNHDRTKHISTALYMPKPTSIYSELYEITSNKIYNCT